MPVQEQYREANDRIRVPEELLRRTEAAVRQEEKKRKIYVFRRYAAVAAAACLCLVCIGVWSFSVRDRIIVQDVEISADEFSAGMNLGHHCRGRRNGGTGRSEGKYTEYGHPCRTIRFG